MSIAKKIGIGVLAALVLLAGAIWLLTRPDRADIAFANVTGGDPVLGAPEAETIPTVVIADPVGWPPGAAPVPAAGLRVSRFAEGLDHPRTMLTLPNGDVLVALTRAPAVQPPGEQNWLVQRIQAFLFRKAGAAGASPDQVVLLRDTDRDGRADRRFVLGRDFASPSGLAWANDILFVANHDAVYAWSYRLGETTLSGTPRKIMDLAPGPNHWMRNLLLSPDAAKLYVAVGSASNIGERGMAAEEGRALIWEYDLQSGSRRIFGAGLRNPNGMAWSPWSGELWTTVNERDMLGSDLVPDYLTNVPVGAQYGWPWVYWKDNFDQRVKAPQPQFLTEYTRRPEFALGPHVAPLGLVFSQAGTRLGERFSRGAIIANHGSWNRSPPSGYNVVYVAFDARGNPQGRPVPLLTGFLTGEGTTRGRPTWVAWAGDGALLVSDDTAGIIWRLIDPKARPAPAIQRLTADRLPPQRALSGLRGAFGEEDYARE
ncbi:PQQ-dependent sugar dehydrogenase [Qipengyuania sediminis]|uniref:PQQ-dependent sugar dehydrogenase n=1 Tax=Qipengyuania sediminis TaxID=1532023 RepID=UPI00105A7C97|nr:PQQ-dependent sugar dehydrogenase [Qipengyuania sediminis]